MNSPLRRFIGSGSRDGCETIARASASGFFFWDLELEF
jgi:hypothetical protein